LLSTGGLDEARELEGKVTDNGAIQVWQKQDGSWKLLARASYRLRCPGSRPNLVQAENPGVHKSCFNSLDAPRDRFVVDSALERDGFEPLVPPKMDDAFEAAVPRTPPPGDDPEKPESSSQESKRTRLRDKGGLGESKMAGFGRVGIVPEQILVGGGAGGQAAGRQAGIGDVGQAEQHRVGDGFMHQRIAVDQMQIERLYARARTRPQLGNASWCVMRHTGGGTHHRAAPARFPRPHPSRSRAAVMRR
jgi:hypothetical protein